MAQAVLDLGLQFPKGFRIPLRNKHAIVSEPPGTALLRDDLPFDDSFEGTEQLSLAGENHHTAETRWEFVLPSPLQKLKEGSPIGGIVGAFAGKSSRSDARRTPKRVNLKPGIVRKNKARKNTGNCKRLQNRILLKRMPNFLHDRAVRQGNQVADTPPGPEHLTDFAGFVRIPSCD